MNKIYAKAELCIYCGDTENLTDEHLLAFSLGGRPILKKASCKNHANITSAFELKVARGMYRKFRDINSIQSRRKDGREERLEEGYKLIGERSDGTKVEFSAPLKDVPLPNIWIGFTQIPTILNGGVLNSGLGIVCHSEDYSSNKLKYQKLFAKTGFKVISVESPSILAMAPEYFQMLAKTAHAYLWAERRGVGYTPMLLDIIEGKDVNFTRLIGCDQSLPRSNKPFELHEVNYGGEMYLITHITLMAFPSTPRYLIVSGRCIS
jgi:hypothetical protein